MESTYGEIAPKYPQHYACYQYRWTIAAGRIYDAGGVEALKGLWEALKGQKEILDDAELAKFLSAKPHPSIANVLLKWDEK